VQDVRQRSSVFCFRFADGTNQPRHGIVQADDATNNPLGACGFKIDPGSDDSLQKPIANIPDDHGSHVRFLPSRDEAARVDTCCRLATWHQLHSSNM